DADLFMAGAGSDIWGTADSFRYVYQTLQGDGAILAHVSAEDAVNPFAKVGVMFRATVDADSPEVILDVKPDGGLEFMTRSAVGGDTVFLAGGSVPVTSTSNGTP